MYIVADIDVEASSFGPAYGPGVASTLIQHPFTVGTCVGGAHLATSELNAQCPSISCKRVLLLPPQSGVLSQTARRQGWVGMLSWWVLPVDEGTPFCGRRIV